MKGAQCKLANPHSNAAVDLNGDCLAGMFLLSRFTTSGTNTGSRSLLGLRR